MNKLFCLLVVLMGLLLSSCNPLTVFDGILSKVEDEVDASCTRDCYNILSGGGKVEPMPIKVQDNPIETEGNPYPSLYGLSNLDYVRPSHVKQNRPSVGSDSGTSVAATSQNHPSNNNPSHDDSGGGEEGKACKNKNSGKDGTPQECNAGGGQEKHQSTALLMFTILASDIMRRWFYRGYNDARNNKRFGLPLAMALCPPDCMRAYVNGYVDGCQVNQIRG